VGLSSDIELYCPGYGVMPYLIYFSFLNSTFLHAHTCMHMHTQTHTHKDTTYTDFVYICHLSGYLHNYPFAFFHSYIKTPLITDVLSKYLSFQTQMYI